MEHGNNCRDSVCAAWRVDSAQMPHDSDVFLAHFETHFSETEKTEKMAKTSHLTMSVKPLYFFVTKRQKIARV